MWYVAHVALTWSVYLFHWFRVGPEIQRSLPKAIGLLWNNGAGGALLPPDLLSFWKPSLHGMQKACSSVEPAHRNTNWGTEMSMLLMIPWKHLDPGTHGAPGPVILPYSWVLSLETKSPDEFKVHQYPEGKASSCRGSQGWNLDVLLWCCLSIMSHNGCWPNSFDSATKGKSLGPFSQSWFLKMASVFMWSLLIWSTSFSSLWKECHWQGEFMTTLNAMSLFGT